MIYAWDEKLRRYQKLSTLEEIEPPGRKKEFGNDVYMEGVNDEPRESFRYLYDLDHKVLVDIRKYPTRGRADPVAYERSLGLSYWHEIIETGRFWVYRRYK